MRTFLTLSCLAVLLPACGGTEPGEDSGGAGTDPTTTTSTGGTTTSTGTATTSTTSTTFDWPATSDLYVAGESSYLSSLVLPGAKDPCCRDWGAQSRDNIQYGTNEIDNSLAAIGFLMISFGFDLQATIDGVLMDGSFVPLLDFYDYPGPDGDVRLVFHRGAYEGMTDWASASGGMGTYTISDANFVTGTGTPRARFGTANLTAGALDASDGSFEIAMPLAPGAALVLPLQDVALTGMTSEGPMGGIGLSDGELSGHVLLDDFFNAYNVAAEALCGTCANLTGDVYTINAKTGEWEATGCATDTYACVLPDEMSCATLVSDDFLGGGVCGLIPGIIGGVADLDLDGDGTFESLSAGIRTAGVPGEIVGVQ